MYQPIDGVTVIGIGHKARQGKDTVASMIQDRLGSKAERLPFAEDLYAVARIMFGMTKKDPTLLQLLGTEIFRRKSPDIWVESVYHKLMDRKPKVAIITDVRFPNEAEFVQQMGGSLIKVERTAPDGTPHRDPTRSETHPSESSLNEFKGWDFKILNVSGEPERLVDQVENILRQKGLWSGPAMW